MSYTPETGSLVGLWTYRSFLNDPDPATAFNDLEFGLGTIEIAQAPAGIFKGRIFGPGWGCSSTAGSATGIRARCDSGARRGQRRGMGIRLRRVRERALAQRRRSTPGADRFDRPYGAACERQRRRRAGRGGVLVVCGHAMSRLSGHDCADCTAGRPGHASGDGDGRDSRRRWDRACANGCYFAIRTGMRRDGIRTPRLPGLRLADPAARCPSQLDMERHRRNGLRHRRLFDARRRVRRVRAQGDAPVHRGHRRGIDARCDAVPVDAILDICGGTLDAGAMWNTLVLHLQWFPMSMLAMLALLILREADRRTGADAARQACSLWCRCGSRSNLRGCSSSWRSA